uniref:Uncharacterized protein n=1 Tax=Alexandrium andersonii TaxID=327968 RepID=A0A7S2ALU4_9DINO
MDVYLESAFRSFLEVATPTPGTSGMSWVELGGEAMARPSVPGAAELQRRFHKEVGQPALALLSSLASPDDREAPLRSHGAAMEAFTLYAPKHMVPHLGLPFTRRALANLGVAVQSSGSAGNEFPSAGIREECWMVGTW